MQSFPPTHILRHRRENLKKCSLRGLENREGFCFWTYPNARLPNLSNFVMLALEGPPLTLADAQSSLFIIDATWRYAQKMIRFSDAQASIPRRSLPSGFRTAYPRRQDDCPSPEQGLASIEAIFVAYHLLQRDVQSLLDNYYWKNEFLKINEQLLNI